MPDAAEPEAETEREVEEQASESEDDPVTSREALELELMDDDRSDEGEHIA
jgi:hypothetical protein